MPRISALLTGMLVFGCASYAQEVERVRSELIGLRGHMLRRCMPVPAASETEGELERVVYRWRPVPRDSGRYMEVFEPHEFPPSERKRNRELGEFLLEGERPGRQPFCQLTFELREGLIQGVQPEGRDAEGLNADALCLMQARACLPPQPQPQPQPTS
ncbi:MAG: hypothetical protein J4G09_00105 [Proteobacteria bacterium]|nr:hypothetical protein [Pseudomonadota bacterium]